MLPDYILLRGVKPGGVRLPRWPQVIGEIAGQCCRCGLPVYQTKFNGVYQLNGVWRSGEYFHRVCAPTEDIKPPVSPKVAAGNLKQEEYRWWIGEHSVSAFSSKNFSICRACRTVAHSVMGRNYHFKDEAFLVGGMSCPVRLTRAYEILKKEPTCIVCKRHRAGHTKWGVPICDSPSCEYDWKFGETRYFRLEKILRDQREAALNSKEGCAVAIINSSETGEHREIWCDKCGRLQSPEHKAVHEKIEKELTTMWDDSETPPYGLC